MGKSSSEKTTLLNNLASLDTQTDGEVLLNRKNGNYTAEIELNLYSFILNRVQELNGKMQVIILDHANLNNDDFKSAVIEKWWNEEILIPESRYKN